MQSTSANDDLCPYSLSYIRASLQLECVSIKDHPASIVPSEWLVYTGPEQKCLSSFFYLFLFFKLLFLKSQTNQLDILAGVICIQHISDTC